MPAEHISSTVLSKGKWLVLEEVRYRDESGKERTWEMVSRTTKPKESDSDCVAAFATLKKKGQEDSFVFVRQYRPCLEKYTLEFPAGLVDAGETIEQACLRELKEETGYTGKIVDIGPPVSLDGGLSNTCVRVAFVDIDGEDKANADVRKEVQEGEFTEVLVVPVSKSKEKMKEMSEAGDIVDSRVYAFLSAFRT